MHGYLGADFFPCSQITEKTVKRILEKNLNDDDDIKEEFEVMRDMDRPNNTDEIIEEVNLQANFVFPYQQNYFGRCNKC